MSSGTSASYDNTGPSSSPEDSPKELHRAGAIVALTPEIDGIKDIVKEEKPVLGICNGAQILAEVGLVPGVFTLNEKAQFICEWADLKVRTNRTPFTHLYQKNEVIKMPIAHAEGRYYTEYIDELRDQDQIVLGFAGDNPIGSLAAITGVCDWKDGFAPLCPTRKGLLNLFWDPMMFGVL